MKAILELLKRRLGPLTGGNVDASAQPPACKEDVEKSYRENPVLLKDDDEMNRAVEDLTDSYKEAQNLPKNDLTNKGVVWEDKERYIHNFPSDRKPSEDPKFVELTDEQATLDTPPRPTDELFELYKRIGWKPPVKVIDAAKRLNALFDKEGFDVAQYQKGIEAEIGLLKEKQAKSEGAIEADKKAMEKAGKQQGAYRQAQIKKYHFSNADWHRLDELSQELAILNGDSAKYISDRLDVRG